MCSAIRTFLMIAFIVVLAGCATMTIEGDGQKTPESTTGTHTVHGSFYDFVWSEPPVDKCENGKALYRARYHTNMVYALTSVISLGLYVPQTVEWWCNGAVANDLEEGIYQPGYSEEEYKPGYSF
ncbi:MAG: hypothetical protein WCY88_13195 [Spongiibacteraceae bacterium]